MHKPDPRQLEGDDDDSDRGTAYVPPGSLTYEFNMKSKQSQAAVGHGSAEDEEYYIRETGDNRLDRERSVSLVKRTIPEDWEDDNDAVQCKSCSRKFSLLVRKHHCRNCGLIFCDDCTKNRSAIKTKNYHTAVRVCGRCSFSLSKGRELVPNLQLKHQISAMEDVSQALMQENQHLRSLIDNMEQINKEQATTIHALCQQEQQFLDDIRKFKSRPACQQCAISELGEPQESPHS